MEFVDKKTLRIDKELNELDKFVFDFLSIIEKHTEYVIISGYVPILFGRSRATEDVDIFIEELAKDELIGLWNELKGNGWICMGIDDGNDAFSYLDGGTPIRFYREPSAIPNIEVKFARKKFDKNIMDGRMKVIIGERTIFVSSLEEQIIYKRYVLGSGKDEEDAKHMEEAFKDVLDKDKLDELKEAVRRGEHEL